MMRRDLPDGQTLIVHGRVENDWHLQLGDREIIGWPLNSMLAELLGYDVATEDWPPWVDRLAEDLADA